MKINELWLGNRAEREAQATVKRLTNRVDSGEILSASQKLQFHQATTISEGISRRRFLLLLGGGATALATGSAGWLFSQPRQDGSTIAIDASVKDRDQWNALSPEDRLHRLWRRRHPEIQEFNSQEALVKSCAEFFCKNTASKYTPEEIVRRIVYVPTKEEYVDIAIAKGMLKINIPSTADETKDEYGKTSDGQTSSEEIVYINTQGMNEKFANCLSTDPEARRKFQTTDLVAQWMTYVFLHEFGHLNESSEEIQLEEPVNLQFSNGRLSILSVKGLGLNVIAPDSPDTVQVLNVDEALIDYQAFQLCARVGNDITQFINNSYAQGRALVSDLNTASGVDFNTHNNVISGTSSIVELLSRWGDVNLYGRRSQNSAPQEQFERGLKALALIGAVSNGWISNEVAMNGMQVVFAN